MDGARKREAIFDSFVNIIHVANSRGMYAADTLAHALESRLTAWQGDLFGVSSIHQAMIVVVRGSQTEVPSEVLVKVSIASENHYLRWLPLKRRWGLVQRTSDGKQFSEITSQPVEIGREIIGGMLSMHLAEENGQYSSDLNLEAPPVDPDMCFLCNVRPAATKEHVFPKWLQNDFGLWDKRIHLINNTPFRYKSLTVPACTECNCVHLRKIENVVSQCVRGGYHVVRSLSTTTIFQWLGKILLGLLVKETQLRLDQRDQTNKQTIIPTELFSGVNTLRNWLSSVYRPVIFEKPYPWVVYVFRMQTEMESGAIDFQYADSISDLSFMIHMGETGMIMVAMDHLLPKESGATIQDTLYERLTTATYGRLIREQIKDHPLHPLQLMELYSRIVYQHSLASPSPAFRISAPPDSSKYQRLRIGNIPVPYEVEEWDDSAIHYGVERLARAIGWEIDTAGSWLLDENSNFVRFSDQDITVHAGDI